MTSTLFSQSLSGLIKALRNSKGNEQGVVKQALQEVASETKSTDWDLKAAAVLKLIYLEMLGYPAILTYSFNVLECMASPKFHIKQIGYLAASQSFGASTEVILLANNLIKKDLTTSSHPSTVILALTSLPSLLVASPQLAEDLLPDLLRMLTHSKPQVRRIATLTLGKIWCTSYPSSTATDDEYNDNSVYNSIEFSHLEKLRSGLSDDDPSVVSATVNVMLELARSRKDSLQSLLPLAPELFDLLTNSSNNWMLIKIAKLFALLTPIEPRLVRKLLPPLTNLISTSPAFSLLYECIQTIITGGMLADADASTPLAKNCIEKLSAFLSDRDQNLRYIALKGLSRLLHNAPHTTPLLVRHYDEILACIEEEDLTIRLKALELVERLTDRSNCKQIVNRLLEQVNPSSSSTKKTSGSGLRSAAGALRAISSSYDTSSPSGTASDVSPPTSTSAATSYALHQYRYRLLLLILRLTSRSSEDGSQLYVNITNFEWYIDTLINVAYLSLSVTASLSLDESAKLAGKISDGLLDISARAASIRPVAIQRSRRLLADESFGSLRTPITEAVTSACAFILGEYGEDSKAGEHAQLLAESNTARKAVSSDVYLAAMQCLSRWLIDVANHWQEDQSENVKRVLVSTKEAMLTGSSEETALYGNLIQIVVEGLNGPRRAIFDQNSSEKPSNGVDNAGDSSGNDGSIMDNPFASSSSQKASQVLGKASGPPESMYLLYSIFSGYELRPLAPNAQALVQPPDDLDLESPIGSTSTLEQQAESGQASREGVSQDVEVDEYGRPKATLGSTSAAMLLGSSEDGVGRTSAKSRDKRKKKDKKGSKSARDTPDYHDEENDEDVDDIPIVKLELSDDDRDLEGARRKSTRKGKESSSKVEEDGGRSKGVEIDRAPSPPPIILTSGGDAPVAPVSRASSLKVDGDADTIANKMDGIDKAGVDHSSDPAAAKLEDNATIKVIKKKKKKKREKVKE
ncbi:ARM repeat-containing protein [Cystobasidium minutum MCA 4210]|uniref:ARM repeat-containing protein n=1 Tax=Cystobasidium minutum MCA 4210 TaxID=1397322 RepID=UPI0034CE6BFB|eukprot:jgi/Rhomi1/189993/estExt_fgenesh1_pg.C_4_t20149